MAKERSAYKSASQLLISTLLHTRLSGLTGMTGPVAYGMFLCVTTWQLLTDGMAS